MRVTIIEDETPAANRLNRMLQTAIGEVEVVSVLDSVESSVQFLQSGSEVDLIFMDVQLADGLCFSIFEQVKVYTPVIFTTAFDHYTLKAFKVNSLDYLLKPIDEKELVQAVDKYRLLYPAGRTDSLTEKLERLMQAMRPSQYKERLLIRKGQQLHYLKTADTAYCIADGKLCYAADFSGKSYLLDHTLQQLEEMLAPGQFYRVNRQLLVNIDAVKKVYTFLGGRLKLELSPPPAADTLVSRERVSGFKEWLGK